MEQVHGAFAAWYDTRSRACAVSRWCIVRSREYSLKVHLHHKYCSVKRIVVPSPGIVRCTYCFLRQDHGLNVWQGRIGSCHVDACLRGATMARMFKNTPVRSTIRGSVIMTPTAHNSR